MSLSPGAFRRLESVATGVRPGNVRMTREAILIIIFCVLPALPVAARNQSAPASAPANNPATPQDKTQASPGTTPQPSSPAPAQKPSAQTAAPAKHPHKKKAVSSSCSSAPASSATSTKTANCAPPAKVIVKQGGAADNSIQLAGAGAGSGASSNQKDTANQMLATTESNLKKISGQQLSSDQKDMVSQIRQFMEQSKAAEGDGDMERARTLAWKAQVLSEELVKPAQ